MIELISMFIYILIDFKINLINFTNEKFKHSKDKKLTFKTKN